MYLIVFAKKILHEIYCPTGKKKKKYDGCINFNGNKIFFSCNNISDLPFRHLLSLLEINNS